MSSTYEKLCVIIQLIKCLIQIVFVYRLVNENANVIKIINGCVTVGSYGAKIETINVCMIDLYNIYLYQC